MEDSPKFCNPSARASVLRGLVMFGAAIFATAERAFAQYTFSINRRGPNITIPDSATGTCITAGDILTAAAPGVPAYFPPFLPPPAKLIPAGAIPFPGLGIPTGGPCTCAPPLVLCPLEVDALSYGMDFNPAGMPALAGQWVFSVDEFASGFPSLLPPNVATEGVFGGGTLEAAADVFEALGVPVGPLAPPAAPFSGNTGIIDGNGFISPSGALYPGVGLVEPLPPVLGPIAPGDDVDAIDLDTPFGTFPVYFSLDAAFFDPLRGIPNLGSAAANGFPPGAILITPVPGVVPFVYAPPAALGLDLFGPGTDDLDALAITENGIPLLQIGPGGDAIYFSVRRGSAIIGFLDSLFGIPIEEGDILTFPTVPGAPPSIYIAAEWLGLATARTFGVAFGDDLDALDCRAVPETGVPFCIGDGFQVACACGNNGVAPNGCANSVNPAGANLVAAGAASLAAPTVTLTTSGTPFTAFCIVVQSPTQIAPLPFGDGMRCFTGPFLRMYKGNAFAGVFVAPPPGGLSIPARSAMAGAPIPAFGLRFYQTYYRNPDPLWACPLPATFNVTNAVAIQWFP